MTVYTFKFFNFIISSLYIVFKYFCLVAGLTVNFKMLSFQGKTRAVVVETISVPSFCYRMATRAIGYTLHLELRAVHIVMASDAGIIQSTKLLIYQLSRFGKIEVTRAAGNLVVPALQLIICCAVIKVYFLPRVRVVALSTVISSVILLADKSIVNIVVAIDAAFANVFKLPLVFA